LKKYYRDPFYRNSIAMMLNSAFGAFFGLLFWIVAARTMPLKGIGLATAAISAAALIVALSRLGLDGRTRKISSRVQKQERAVRHNRNGDAVLALVLTAVFMVWINIFSPALSFLRDGWFLLYSLPISL